MDIPGSPVSHLKCCYIIQLRNGSFSSSELAAFGFDKGESSSITRMLLKRGLIRRISGKTRYVLSPQGRARLRVVLAGGVFDIVHPGHVSFLKEAASHGNLLVVVVARDATVRKRKGRNPFVRESDRLAVVESLKPVDAALLGSLSGFIRTIERVSPDLVILGHDQDEIPGVPAQRSKTRLREYSTSRILRAIKESLDNNSS